jgi:hypothetical protein
LVHCTCGEQEGHTAHATREDALGCAREMLDVYADCVKDMLVRPFAAVSNRVTVNRGVHGNCSIDASFSNTV